MAGWIGRHGALRFRLFGGAGFAALAVITVICVSVAAAVAPPAAAAQTSATPAACARAAALISQGYLTDAEALLKANLGSDPCVPRELQRLHAAQRARTSTPYFESQVRAIRGLIAAGFAAEAQKQIQALVQANPNRPIPADLRAYNQRLGWWQMLLDTTGPPVRTVLEMFIGFLALVVIVLLALQLAGGLIRRRWPATYMIGAVTGIESSDSTKHTELLKAELTGLSDASYGHGPVRRASSAEQGIAIPSEITSAIPQAQLLVALMTLLDRLLPRRLTRVNLAVLPTDPIRGLGLTVQVATRSGRAKGDQTVWVNDYFPHDSTDRSADDDVCRLMLPAAVWLAYQPSLQTSRHRDRINSALSRAGQHGPESWQTWADAKLKQRQSRPKTRLYADEPRSTDSWESFAHFAVAERAQGVGNLEEARRGYLMALGDDSNNKFALLNLAGLKLYRGPNEDEETAAGRLRFAKFLLWESGNPDEIPPDGFVALRWLYLASSWALCAPRGSEDRELALPFAETLYRLVAPDDMAYVPDSSPESLDPTLLYQRLNPTWTHDPKGGVTMRRPPNELEALKRLKESMRAPAWILVQSARLQRGLEANAEDQLKKIWWSASVLYNFACFYARRARGNPASRPADLTLATSRLIAAIDRADEPALLRAMAAADPILDEVQARMAPKPAQPDYSSDAHIGRSWGVRVHEAVKSTVVGQHNGRHAAPALPEGANGQGQ